MLGILRSFQPCIFVGQTDYDYAVEISWVTTLLGKPWICSLVKSHQPKVKESRTIYFPNYFLIFFLTPQYWFYFGSERFLKYVWHISEICLIIFLEICMGSGSLFVVWWVWTPARAVSPDFRKKSTNCYFLVVLPFPGRKNDAFHQISDNFSDFQIFVKLLDFCPGTFSNQK